ncbi:MAG: PEP/pyruvate-binding domain-containing protein [Candidatus Micrarchaeota archaeon]
MELARDFKNLGKNDAAIAGGKGASLGEMTQAGIPVPPGFVILAGAFEQFIEEAELKADIDSVLHNVNHEEMHTVEKASEKIQALILESKMPKDIEKEILIRFKKLDAQFVAVRSSATAEDSLEAAWAGQLESYLNTTKKTLLENVKRCWASLFTPRAIFYRFEKGLHDKHISVAVVVQKMVESEVSGIGFSVHPVTQDYNQLIIEAGFGLGEAIVSGSVTPDNYIVEKKGWQILDTHVSTQTRALVRKKNGGNEWIDLSEEKGGQQVLNEKQILELAKLIVRIEQHYGFPVDTEWAYEKGKFYIVQSRPITTLAKKAPAGKKNDELTRPAESALTWYKLLARPDVDLPTISQIDVVFYGLIWEAVQKKEELLFTELKKRQLTHYIGNDPKFVGRFAYKKYFKKPAQVIDYYKKGRVLLANNRKETARWSGILQKEESDGNLLSAFKNFRNSYKPVSEIYSIISWFAIETWQEDFDDLLNGLIQKNGLEKQREQILLSAYKPWKKTALIELQEKLAKGQSPEKLAQEYQFLRSWVIIWFNPITTDWIKSLQTPAKSNRAVFSFQKLVSLLKPSKEEKEFLEVAPHIVFFKDWRDDVRRMHAFSWSFLFDAIAKRFGILREDLGYLTLEEIERIIQSGTVPVELVNQRKQKGCIVTLKQAEPFQLRVIDEVSPRFEAIIKSVEQQNQNKFVSGKIAQNGIARGIVKILRSYHDIKHVQQGQILIANSTHPNYLPAMQKAAAFVTNEGGLISHAAIVAREMKKPCIVGTQIATKVFKDGDFVEVDANQGKVFLVQDSPVAASEQQSEVPKFREKLFVGNEEWNIFVTRNMSFWHQYLSNYGHFHMPHKWDMKIPLRFLVLTEGGTHTTIFKTPENAGAFDRDVLEAFSSLKRIQSIRKKYLVFGKRLLSLQKTCQKAFTVSNWKKFSDAYALYTHGLAVTATMGRIGTEKLLEKLEKAGISKSKLHETVSVITYPKEHTPLFESGLDLLLIGILAQAKKANEKKVGTLLEKWLQKYRHIPVNFCDEPWTLEDAQKQLDAFLQKDCAKEHKELEKSHQKRILEAKKRLVALDDHEIMILALGLQEATFLNEYRKNIFSRISLEIRPLFSKIAEKAGLRDWHECFYLLPEEIDSVLKNRLKDAQPLLDKRRAVAMVTRKNGKIEFLDEKETRRVKGFIHELHQKKHSVSSEGTEVSGFSANGGNVRGTVRIIMDTHDFDKLNAGDILVTAMTSVEFIPVMQKAAAFVTNEGGITSHAAIVSREMNKPCIIGTKNATQILKDGDFVEVDADKGIVRKIGKPKP